MIAEKTLKSAAWKHALQLAKGLPVRSVVTLLLAAVCSACLNPPADPISPEPAERAEQIATLRLAIDRDHASLERLITDTTRPADEPIYDDPEVRAIAKRLTGQERALDRLLSPPVAPPAVYNEDASEKRVPTE